MQQNKEGGEERGGEERVGYTIEGIRDTVLSLSGGYSFGGEGDLGEGVHGTLGGLAGHARQFVELRGQQLCSSLQRGQHGLFLLLIWILNQSIILEYPSTQQRGGRGMWRGDEGYITRRTLHLAWEG